jgi:hypothetical protein
MEEAEKRSVEIESLMKAGKWEIKKLTAAELIPALVLTLITCIMLIWVTVTFYPKFIAGG